MTDPQQPRPDPVRARQALLSGLGQALALLADKLTPHGDAAREVATLAAQAEELANRTWAFSRARAPDPRAAAELAAAFQSFIAEAADLAERAGRAAAGSREVAATIRNHADDLAELGRGFAGVDDIAALRARLRPLAASLEALPARLQAGREVAADVARLGTHAGELADVAQKLTDPRQRSTAAMAAYQGLRDFAVTAGEVAGAMLKDAERVHGAVAGLAGRATILASASAAAETARRVSAQGRMQEVIEAGRQARPPEPPRPAVAPRDAVVWGTRAGEA